jgi:hypothetical protein
MPIGMEANINEPQLPFQDRITGDGTAIPVAPVDSDDLPASIAVRLKWHRRFRKDKTLDYEQKELESGIVHLEVSYGLKPGERKTAFVEIVNNKNGQKVKSNRVTFEGQPDFPGRWTG